MDYCLIKAGKVADVIVADPAFAAAIRPDWDAVVASDGAAGIGWTWDGNQFAAPPASEGPTPTAPRRISVGAFYDRFGAAKWAILADESPQVRAVVRDASVRSFIDLDNPDLPAGLAILQAAGHDIDPAAIIDAPVLPAEVP